MSVIPKPTRITMKEEFSELPWQSKRFLATEDLGDLHNVVPATFLRVVRTETEGFGYSRSSEEALARVLKGEETESVVETAFSTFIQYLVLDTALALHDNDERLFPTPTLETLEGNERLPLSELSEITTSLPDVCAKILSLSSAPSSVQSQTGPWTPATLYSSISKTTTLVELQVALFNVTSAAFFLSYLLR
ncbi:hypothetical protein H0H81_005036, partial [Sphagnurus paluster]